MLDKLRPWAWLILVGFLTLLLVSKCRSARTLADELEQARERATLRDAGQIVLEPVADLRPSLERLERENVDLRTALDKARKASRDARSVLVAQASTAPAPVSTVPTSASASCVLAQGDTLRLQVDEVLLQTEAGNRILVGTAAAYRGDGALLLRAPFSTPVTWAREAAPEAVRRGWGAGPWLGAGSDGWAAGVAVAAPVGRLPGLGWGLELSGGIGLGPSGRAAGSLQFVIRP